MSRGKGALRSWTRLELIWERQSNSVSIDPELRSTKRQTVDTSSLGPLEYRFGLRRQLQGQRTMFSIRFVYVRGTRYTYTSCSDLRSIECRMS